MSRFILTGDCSSKGTYHLRFLPLEDRFWIKVRRNLFGCWEWQGTGAPGYGLFRGGRKGKLVLAHRFSWELKHGPIPNNLDVLHKCDNPSCVRPSHLFLGTQSENNQDSVKKGRWHRPKGEKHYTKLHPEKVLRGESIGTAKLTEAKVIKIRKQIKAGASFSELAREHSVSLPTIIRAATKETWRHV